MEDGIRHAGGELVSAVNRGDAAAAAELYESGAWLLSPSAELIAGRCEIEAYWRAGVAVGVDRVELRPDEVRVVDGVAIEIGRYVIGTGVLADTGKYAVLHRRQDDGTWRRAVDVFNPDLKEES
jgi:ketosteroid isomerase-like protein